ncbi:MAG: glutamate--cysteine ligase [Gammaproteobacteria bacterium]
MYVSVERALADLRRNGEPERLAGGLVGLEKESLRVADDGGIARTRHPSSLGAPLTHPWITTDYAESLLEFITPPHADVRAAMGDLSSLHAYVYRHLEGELLWATSMPCVLAGEERIPIAQYGTSNPGRMKHIYRVGLGHRYGRVMQVIAGVHFNYSVPEAFWPVYQAAVGESERDPRRFRDERYMGLIRNLQRVGWLVPYLFGASPAVCKSFFAGKTTRLEEFDQTTYYEPYATSLRMGDIGYQNRRERGVGVQVCYDSLAAYVKSLARAIETPAPAWEVIGVKVDGEYRQLNANILQIENEYYSSVRPKQVLDGLEKPTLALRRRGIRYIELRSLDVNAYHPLGIDEVQGRFIEVLLLFCLLAESPGVGMQERWEIDRNFEKVAHRGRDPEFRLVRSGRGVPLAEWGAQVLDGMEGVAEVLDHAGGAGGYRAAIASQRAKLADPQSTPSGRMLAEMRENGEGFYQLAKRLSVAHARYFRDYPLSAERRAMLDAEAVQSVARQAAIEAEQQEPFDVFLARYFAQH